jgi:hypothetical protein
LLAPPAAFPEMTIYCHQRATVSSNRALTECVDAEDLSRKKAHSSVNRHADMLVAEPTALPSIDSVATGPNKGEPPMRTLALVTDGVSVQLAWHAAPNTANATAARGGV